MTLGYNVKLGYLHKVRKHYFGLTWNALDFVTRSNNNLGNSSNFYRLSSDILLSWSYSHALKKNRSLELGLDYGILSFMNTAPSFTANLPQNVIDNGEVSFFDSSTRNPYDLSYLTAKTVHNQLLLNTYIRFNFKKKLSLAYSWKLRSFYDHKSYPVTDAFHTLSLQYNFIRHIK
ncbi:hypothetical protein [Lishizhenia tianjinensis]|nr:hypothetical protein [Lishizhenia tianjinensis]